MKQKRLLSGSASLTRAAVAIVLLAAAFFLNRFAAYIPENILTSWRGFSLAYSSFVSKFAGRLPFSLAELIFYALILTVVTAFATVLSSIITFKEAGRMGSFISGLLVGAGILVLLYYLLFGLWFNFDSPVMRKIERVSPTTELLYAASADMQGKANALSREIPRKTDGTPNFGSFEELAEAVCERYGKRLEGLTDEPAEVALPKKVLWSVGLSQLGITGIYIPYTGECNLNSDVPVVSLPFTMAHELSHRYGTAREDECNYIAIDLLLDANEEESYSAAFMGYLYLTNALYKADPELWQELKDTEDPLLSSDLAIHLAYWKSYEGKSRQVASAINDAQLKINGQKDGEQSYGRVTDLLISRYAAESK